MSGEMSVSCLCEAILSSLTIGLNELLICAFSIGIGLNIFNEKLNHRMLWKHRGREKTKKRNEEGVEGLVVIISIFSIEIWVVQWKVKLRGCSWLSWITLNHEVYLYESHGITLNTLVFSPVFYNQYILYITSHNIWLWALILDN